jgi:cytochrome c oxidase subunit 4
MSSNNDKPHIVPYRTFIFVLLALLVFTFTSIGVTSYNLGPYSVLAALLLATAKTILVLTFFMHLKWDVKMFSILVAAVMALIGVVIFITFLDYLFR